MKDASKMRMYNHSARKDNRDKYTDPNCKGGKNPVKTGHHRNITRTGNHSGKK